MDVKNRLWKFTISFGSISWTATKIECLFTIPSARKYFKMILAYVPCESSSERHFINNNSYQAIFENM